MNWLLRGDNLVEPALAFLIIQLLLLPLQVAFWPHRDSLHLEHCNRCGKPTHDMLYHRAHCLGRPKELRTGSLVRRRW